MIYFCIAVGILIVGFIGWRYTSVARGMRQRDQKLLAAIDPIAEKFEKKQPVAADEIANLIRRPQYRPMLYQMLKHFGRLDLFPQEALSIEAQGAGILAYWMMHPNELQDAPAEIELVEEVERNLEGEDAMFLVFRYRMPAGHWAEKDGWLLGLAGPFLKTEGPYSGFAAGFSRCEDKYGEVKPEDLIDGFFGTVAEKNS